MSEENLSRVRHIHAEWARGNWEAGRELMATDAHVSWQVPEGFMDAHGLEELTPKVRDFLGQWREFRFEANEFTELNEDSFLVTGSIYGVGKASGVEVKAPGFYVWRFHNDRIVRFHAGFAREEALIAAGLSE